MKSAYELAMERLEKAAPSISLTEEQKKQLAEVESKFKARIAEREVRRAHEALAEGRAA